MFDEAQEYLSSYLALHGIEQEGRRDEEDEGLENVSGYFNVASEERKEIEEEK